MYNSAKILYEVSACHYRVEVFYFCFLFPLSLIALYCVVVLLIRYPPVLSILTKVGPVFSDSLREAIT